MNPRSSGNDLSGIRNVRRTVGKYPGAGRAAGLERALAYFIVVGSQIPLGSSQYLRISLAAIIPLLPVFLSGWSRGKWEKCIIALVISSIVSGLLLALKNSDQSRSFDSRAALSESLLPLILVIAAASFYWSYRVLGAKQFLVLWSISAALFAPLMGGRFLENPWKFGLALPLSLLAIIIAGYYSSKMVTLAIVALMALSASLSFRSWLLVLGMALLIHLFRSSKVKAPASNGRWRKIGIVIALGTATVFGGNLMSDLALQGRLGEYAQTRTQQSIEASGNPFFGSRAEWGGAVALAQTEPLGMGVGIAPSSSDWATTISSLSLTEGLKDRSNVADSFRAGRIEFHSTLWNYWSYFGLAGAALSGFAIYFLFKAVLSLHTYTSNRIGIPVGALAVLFTGAIWDILFSPVNSWTLAFALVVCVAVIRMEAEAHTAANAEKDAPK
ncbi:hypothetical protein [Pseudarthrobacter chlorophenolicus]|uniref:hypothetical protein n=1 Tax=Pseudarthrobacter chlorophenolicus TaxID=85085 RepID=UPI000A5E8ABA|nr:hypothetical protein [Pseudarthrobacter chlorophenolicus]